MILHAETLPVRGRFAPTPSGPLHLGSLMTALASFLQAKAAGGAWLVRIDDLDAPRCPPGMADVILRQLEAHGLAWDEPVRFQSRHVEEYAALLADLESRDLLYPCRCSRVRLKGSSRDGPDGPVYDGACVAHPPRPGRLATRLRVPAGEVCIEDPWLGRLCRDTARDIGDFVVKRADGQPGYQLACVVDEEAQRITQVVRGADLLGSTFRQVALQQILARDTPRYGHLPVLNDARGRKLSKQNHAPAVDADRASANLVEGLRLLGQEPDPALLEATPAEILSHARERWDAQRVYGAAQRDGRLAYNAVQQSPIAAQ